MRKNINSKSQLYKNILEVEELMNKFGFQINGSYMVLSYNGRDYNIGRDSCEFPRQLDEPFWVED
ncbi:hypothetical protein M0R04_04915 [Candidatus Dojkabacteria bacterium]|jgi:hypothetical protein|nr:hypothetical protein [Candidatus Dojkabacteria bacterium]